MCGICGIVGSGNNKVSEETIRNMSDRMEHRGPDDQGHYLYQKGPYVALGHRRLSIIDLSSLGHQPMANEDKSVWVVLNGEIYNFQELKKELEAKGHLFRSATDTEVVAHLYEEYGSDCVKLLRGMFALAVWDEKKRILFLSRDRVGKKPLLYYFDGKFFCFASEFNALLASGLIDKDINAGSVNKYFTFGYIPAPDTIYKKVFKLPPGHSLVLENNNISIHQYWKLNYADKVNIPEQEAADEVLSLLKEATRIRLYSDVPLGAFLSGGIDSSVVVALMSELSGGKVKTFTIGFDDKDYDELSFARNIAKRFNTEHHEFIVRPKALEILPLLVEHYGEPYADSSCIPTYYVSRETRKFVTVALNGDGGDELFAGYERYQAMLMAQRYQRLPWLARNAVSSAAKMLPDSIDPRNRFRRLKRFAAALDMPLNERYVKWVGIIDERLKRDIYSRDFMDTLSKNSPWSVVGPFLNSGLSLLDALLYTDTMTYLPGDLLAKVDIASMANSLEARSPFLDHKLMEFAASLPWQYKMKGLVKKYILKKAIKGLIPSENIYRKKMGFGVPVGKWFRGELKDFLTDNLLSTQALGRGYFKPGSIENMLKQHLAEKADYTYQLWSILMLELWYRRFID